LSSVFARWHTVVDTPDRLEWALRQAVRRSINGRPGVSVVEVSDEVARGAPPRPDPDRGPITRIRSVAADDEVDRAGAVLAAASRPMVVAGGGARAAGAGAALHALAEALDALVMTTASGRGVLPEDRPYNGGLVGLYATPPFDALADRADVVVAVGTRLEETARTGWGGLARARLVHLDADPEAFGSWTEPTVALAGDAALTVARLVERAPRPAVAVAQARAAWRQEIAEAQRAAVGMRVDWTVSPTRAVFAALSEVFGDAAIAQENGMHDLWGYHYPVLRLGPAMTVLTPGEQTMMGFGVASAVGASVAAPRRPVVAVTGDGAFAASRVALHALDGLPRGITVIVLDDQGYGWPRLLRHAAGDDIALTRFATSAIAPPLTGGVRVAEPADGAGLVTALHEARRANDLGTSVVVRIVVADDDVPVGVQRLIGKQRPAEQHDAS
jgi:acetolactate synthase-1/2/3 large subunit